MLSAVSGLTAPSTTTISANQAALQTSDPLAVSDEVLKVQASGSAWEVTAVTGSSGEGAYSLASLPDGNTTLTDVARWQLYPRCAAGTWLTALNSSCVAFTETCPIGSRLTAGGRFGNWTACRGCPVGQWSYPQDSLHCTACTGGAYGVFDDAASCLPCPQGTYGDVTGAASLAVACPLECAAGTFGDVTGATSEGDACPFRCPANTYGNATGGGSVEEACPHSCPLGSCGTALGSTSEEEACPNVCPLGAPLPPLLVGGPL